MTPELPAFALENRYLNDRELRALLAAARTRPHPNARRDHAALVLLGNSGIRPSEALALRAGDVHATDHAGWIRIRRLKRRVPGGVLADLELSRPVARVLARFLAAARVPADARPFPFTLRQFERLFRFYARRAGLHPAFRLYTLRHTAISRIVEATGDLRLAQELAGHASPSTTAIYAHVSPERRRRVVEAVATVI